jgi:non-specific serine/threonine protein kinase/serine/threonine-protein kinase
MELFIQVCEGVQHAHQKAIIHRDLKPSNILVTEVDGKPTVRIIDFGLAKAMAQRLTAASIFTQVGAILGTPEYMSPEQAEPGGEDIDTRTDVYSLGVVLYQLLVGAVPLELRELAYKEMLRRLREDEAPRPSSRITTQGEDSAITAKNRGTDPPSLTRQLRGDPDAVVLKALEKDRKRRYGSPMELGADLGRYLRNEPVSAHPASAWYRAGKYVRRHRLGVGMAAAAVLVLAGVAVSEAVLLRRAIEESERAKRERDRADRITQFMTNMFKVSNPSEARGNTITAREILDKSSADIRTGLTDNPELQAQMMRVMGNVYNELGLYSRAQSLLQQSLEIQQHVLGPDHPETLETMNTLAAVLAHEGRYTEAEKLNRQTLDIRRRVLGPDHPDTLGSMHNLAIDLQFEGHFAEAEKLDQKSLETYRRILGPEHPYTLTSMSGLALDLSNEGRYAEAERLFREALEIQRRIRGTENPDTLESMNELAIDLLHEGHYAEAERLNRQTLDIRRRVLGPDHPDTLCSMDNLAHDLQGEGHYAEAEKLDRESLEISRRVLGPEHLYTLNSMSGLALDLLSEGRDAEAEKLYREALEIQRRVLGPDHPETALSIYNLSCIKARHGRRDEALSLLREAVEHGLAAYVELGMEKDSDLRSLHGDPRFDALLTEAKTRAAAGSSK